MKQRGAMSHKRYAILVSFFAVIIFGIPASFMRVWSDFVGELSDVEVVECQKINPHSLYLSGIRDGVIGYKMELCGQLNPDVVAVGSSRSMQIRANFFNTSFVNLGGSANSIPELDYVASRLINLERKPSLVLIFADVLWFNEKNLNPRLVYTPSHQQDYMT